MTYPDAISRLAGARRFGMKLGLEPMQAMAEKLGNPQDGLRFIHLAGSNGKGSTAAFCESCLRATGHRVGLYTSPHLVSIRERIQIDRRPMAEAAFSEGMAAVVAAAEGEPTFFELMTALALWYFAREKVDWVVWETGLGGRLDATNIVQPAVCIITSLTLEHTEYLGQSIDQIAFEKAGIIKRGVPFIYGGGDLARAVFEEAGRGRHAVLVDAAELKPENLGLKNGRQWAEIQGRPYELGLIGSHQVRNAACAVRALQKLPEPPSAEAITRGLASTSWPGRFQIVSESPLIVLDGAHNPAAMEELMKTWGEFLVSRGLPPKEADLVFATSVDKDIEGVGRAVGGNFEHCYFPRLVNERAADPQVLATQIRGKFPPGFPGSVAAWQSAGRPALFTGSLFLVGEMLAHLSGAPGDLKLNERLESHPSSQ